MGVENCQENHLNWSIYKSNVSNDKIRANTKYILSFIVRYICLSVLIN